MDSKTAIRKTLTYSDIFQYPLTLDEIYRFLITDRKYTKSIIAKALLSLDDIVKIGDYYAFKSKENVISLRERKKAWNEEKIARAVSIAQKLCCIPSILFIGISGGVAMKNAGKNEDIDFFVITKKNTLWVSRLLLVLFLSFLGVLRKRSTKRLQNTICLNMLIDETALLFPKERQDIYTAHEIVQMMPVFGRKDIYARFLQANIWIRECMPNSLSVKAIISITNNNFFEDIFLWILSLSMLETLAKVIQIKYMKEHITKETISATVIAFHPLDYRKKTLVQYKRKIKKYV